MGRTSTGFFGTQHNLRFGDPKCHMRSGPRPGSMSTASGPECRKTAALNEQLAERLAEFGVKDTPVNLRNKVARGGFSAVFFVQCLRAIGVSDIRL